MQLCSNYTSFLFHYFCYKQRISRELHKVTVLLSVMGTELQLTAWFWNKQVLTAEVAFNYKTCSAMGFWQLFPSLFFKLKFNPIIKIFAEVLCLPGSIAHTRQTDGWLIPAGIFFALLLVFYFELFVQRFGRWSFSKQSFGINCSRLGMGWHSCCSLNYGINKC